MRTLFFFHFRPAQFGRELLNGFSVSGQLIVAEPIKACSISENAKEFWGKIVLVERGDCMFVGKSYIDISISSISLFRNKRFALNLML